MVKRDSCNRDYSYNSYHDSLNFKEPIGSHCEENIIASVSMLYTHDMCELNYLYMCSYIYPHFINYEHNNSRNFYNYINLNVYSKI